jgi:hypothetical protein
MSIFLWSASNMAESMDLHNEKQSWLRRMVESHRFAHIILFLILLGNVAASIFCTALLFQRLGSLNVGVGILLLALAAGRLQRLERQRTLGDFGMLSYEISRLSGEVSDLKNGLAPADSPQAKNQNAAFGNHEEFDYNMAKQNNENVLTHRREVRLARILEIILIVCGTIQWGFGDTVLDFVRTACS